MAIELITLTMPVVVKASDETRTATVTLAADAALKFTMAANKKYSFSGRVFFDTTANGDFKWRHVGPASPALVRIHRGSMPPSNITYSGQAVDTAYSAADIQIATASGTNGGYVFFDGIIHNGSNAGDFEFHWAQNTSDPGNTIVRAGSWISYTERD